MTPQDFIAQARELVNRVPGNEWAIADVAVALINAWNAALDEAGEELSRWWPEDRDQILLVTTAKKLSAEVK